MSDIRFEEKILYKTRQHWIIPLSKILGFSLVAAFPLGFITYFTSSYSWFLTFLMFIVSLGSFATYVFYLWRHSWLMVGNQKITMTVRNGLFSQYARNIRYRNIRDCAVSKSNIWSFFLKYGTLFVRSSGAEGDFEVKFVPKVGKVYALINALSRYNDDERSEISSIEKLHNYHQKSEFTNIDHRFEKHG